MSQPGVLGVGCEVVGSRRSSPTTHHPEPSTFPGRLMRADEGVTLLDPGGTIVYDSPSMELLGGYSPFARRGQPISAHIHPEDWPLLSQALGRIRRRHSASLSVTARWRAQDASWRWLESLVTDAHSDPQDAAFLLTSRDITPHVERQMRSNAIVDAVPLLAAEAPPQLWRTLLEAASRVVPADAGSVLCWDAATRELVVVETTLPSSQLNRRIPVGIGAAGLAVQRGAPVVIPSDAHRGSGAPAEAAVPLQYAGTLLGAVCLFREQTGRPFAPEQVEGLAALAGIAAALVLSRTPAQCQSATPALEDLVRELTLLVGYLEVLGSDPQLAPPLGELAESALQAAWRAVEHTRRLGRGDYRESGAE